MGNFVRGIASAPASTDERIYGPELRVDQDLATVWTRYDFFLGENFSHCGYDAFQLLNTAGQWKLVQVADTQRRSAEQCGRGTVPASETKPTAADTAAVVAALQNMFAALSTRDTAAVRSVFIADGVIASIDDQGFRAVTVADWVKALASANAGGDRQRMVNPEVRISDNLATIWTPYDAQVGQQLSHCGTAAVQLAHAPNGWLIAQITQTVRRTSCIQPGRI